MAKHRVRKGKSKHPKVFVVGECDEHGRLIGRAGRKTVKCRQCSGMSMKKPKRKVLIVDDDAKLKAFVKAHLIPGALKEVSASAPASVIDPAVHDDVQMSKEMMGSPGVQNAIKQLDASEEKVPEPVVDPIASEEARVAHLRSVENDKELL
jgi:hypothetical protein